MTATYELMKNCAWNLFEKKIMKQINPNLFVIAGANPHGAVAKYDAHLERIRPDIRAYVLEEHSKIISEYEAFLEDYNRTFDTRLCGYLYLGAMYNFDYAWPIAAVFGLQRDVRKYKNVARFYGLIGDLARHVFKYGKLEELANQLDQVLLQTDNAIFHDSVLMMLISLRCHWLRSEGAETLAEGVLKVPLIGMDEQILDFCYRFYEGLAAPEAEERFSLFRPIMVDYIAREQSILTYHLENFFSESKNLCLTKVLTQISTVSSPVIQRKRDHCQLVFKPYKMPRDFDVFSHNQRVQEFTKALEPLTRSYPDYRAAVDFVHKQFPAILAKFPEKYRYLIARV
ncbi:MAG: hypothetical protein KME57_25570 [Scytonema hyalinum WJT4-NPBG1]|jgi:hypothetical protein|nr:hypothetical protein [Scytonema hyalinum WJT4-NPBG1]